VKLAVGDVVVYGMHGIGRVTGREQQIVLGSTQEVVVVELAEGLTVTLPLERAGAQLRSVASEEDLRKIQEVLREDRVLSTDRWLARKRGVMEKLAEGDPIGLAEIVGEGARRKRDRTEKGYKPSLSAGEREVYETALRLLADEISWARGVEQAEAEGWIDAQLTRAG
jgi:CarD family transcriptional regulator